MPLINDKVQRFKTFKDSAALFSEAQNQEFLFAESKSSPAEEAKEIKKDKFLEAIKDCLQTALTEIAGGNKDKALSLFIQALAMLQGYIEEKYPSDASKNPICVEQECAAFSDASPLNATNLHNCIFVIIRNSNNKFTMGLHVDENISQESIGNMISKYFEHLKIPKDEQEDYPLICHLFGGNKATDNALKNIHSALEGLNVALGQCHVSDAVYDYGRPMNITYNPVTNECYGEMIPFSDPIRRASIIAFNLRQEFSDKSQLLTVATCKNNQVTTHPICDFTSEQMNQLMSNERFIALMSALTEPAVLRKGIKDFKNMLQSPIEEYLEEGCILFTLTIFTYQYLNSNKPQPEATPDNPPSPETGMSI